MQHILIGTSGYSYSWNKGRPSPFKWYLTQGFKSVEINASFYRFPNESWLKTWFDAPTNFTFSIKVHRSITHYTRMKNKRSHELWQHFKQSLLGLESKIDFWLFQMPPDYKYNEENLESIGSFLATTRLGNKAVVEFRDASWWRQINKVEGMGVVFCSVDAPNLPSNLIVTNGVLYLRLHGHKKWYKTIYPEKELDKTIQNIKKLNADKIAIYLNNDHGMLRNGLYLMKKMYT